MRKTVTIIILILCIHHVSAQDYRKIFREDYEHGLSILEKNDALFEHVASKYKVNAAHLKAIVFPELIRYNTVFDFMEITSLKVLYITNGKDYANFSVGYFQMKPSFAEQLETDAIKYLDADLVSGLNLPINGAEPQKQREERVGRLTSIEGQLQYLVLFYKICEKKFKLHNIPEQQKISFLSTCYNAGYHHSYTMINGLSKKNLFYTGRVVTGKRYNYASISRFWFNQHPQLAIVN